MKPICLFMLLMGVVFLSAVMATEEEVEDAEEATENEDAEDETELERVERAASILPSSHCHCICVKTLRPKYCYGRYPIYGGRCCKKYHICCYHHYVTGKRPRAAESRTGE